MGSPESLYVYVRMRAVGLCGPLLTDMGLCWQLWASDGLCWQLRPGSLYIYDIGLLWASVGLCWQLWAFVGSLDLGLYIYMTLGRCGLKLTKPKLSLNIGIINA